MAVKTFDQSIYVTFQLHGKFNELVAIRGFNLVLGDFLGRGQGLGECFAKHCLQAIESLGIGRLLGFPQFPARASRMVGLG